MIMIMVPCVPYSPVHMVLYRLIHAPIWYGNVQYSPEVSPNGLALSHSPLWSCLNIKNTGKLNQANKNQLKLANRKFG